MKREEFLKNLEDLLCDIPLSERQNALEYYRDYFADAGLENEAAVIRELGSPEQVAQTIRDGLYGEQSSYTQTQNSRKFSDKINEKLKKKTNWNLSQVILVVILCILLAVPAGGLLLGAAGIAFGLIVTFFMLVSALVITVGALTIAGIASGAGMIIASFFMFGSPGNALLTAGTGCLMLALGFLFLVLTGLVCGTMIPAIFKGMGKLFNKLFSRGGVRV